MFVFDAEAGIADCDDDEAVEPDCEEIEALDVDDEDADVDDDAEGVDVDDAFALDGLDEVVELAAAADVKLGSASNTSVPAFGAQAMYE